MTIEKKYPGKQLGFDFVEILLVLLVLSILGIVGYVFYDDMTSDHYSLNKNDWECSRNEMRTHLQPMRVGQVTIQQPVTSSICVEYRLK